MNSDRLLIIGIPALVAVLVHLFFVIVMEGGWTVAAPTVSAKPQVIQASLVSLSKSDQTAAKPTSKPKPKPKPKPKSKPESVKALEPKPIPRPDPIIPEPVSADDNKTSTENQLARLQQELLDGLMDLPEAEGQALAEEVSEVQQVAALMQARITQNWRRPPSARNGMEVLLEISLVPTGDVVGISVSSSSGSIAFDRSAIAAVERVAQFSEVAVLPISDFERYFRRFPLRFKPEDLRY
ncbi:cell envelope integrity protein TolA [Luminiphilus sp.]|nr:cell envelope integrity protein TolA [Luminiphilus sp.]MDB3899408.1 cell envelope integrity protein TolA [Luminiphilus sp.]